MQDNQKKIPKKSIREILHTKLERKKVQQTKHDVHKCGDLLQTFQLRSTSQLK